MDYKSRNRDAGNLEQDFFTAGAGNVSPLENSFEPENNLDLSNNATSWAPNSVERHHQSVGNRAVISAENIPDSPRQFQADDQTKIGEIIDIDLPPIAEPSLPEPEATSAPIFNEKLIRTDGDRINKGALFEIDHAIKKFSQTGNAADFYAEVRGTSDKPGMLGSHLKNSYNRELAA